MTEDVSANVRLGVMVCLIAALMSVTLNLTIISTNMLAEFSRQYTDAAGTIKSSIMIKLNETPSVSGATLYRILSENSGMLEFVYIKPVGSTTYTTLYAITDDPKVLDALMQKSYADYKVKVEFDQRNYTIYGEEIAR